LPEWPGICVNRFCFIPTVSKRKQAGKEFEVYFLLGPVTKGE
jgi:hypothetical protein